MAGNYHEAKTLYEDAENMAKSINFEHGLKVTKEGKGRITAKISG